MLQTIVISLHKSNPCSSIFVFITKNEERVLVVSTLFLLYIQIFRYDHPTADILHKDFFGRLEWHGTPDSDIQIGAVYLHNVTYNDTGTYRCTFYRSFILSQYNDVQVVEKDVELSVVAVGKATCTPERTATS